MANNNTNVVNTLTELAPILSGAVSSGNNGLVGTLVGLLHLGSTTSPTAGLDFKNKTMTTTWETGNTATAIQLIAAGWTIIPG
jgi:hypothetical protein